MEMKTDSKGKDVQVERGKGIKMGRSIFCSLCQHRLLDATAVKDGEIKCSRCRKMIDINV